MSASSKSAFLPEQLRQVDPTAERTALLHQYGQYSSPIPDIIRQAEHFTRVNVFDIVSLPHWSKGQALLIGDAAHAVSPNSGQGTSMALEDAMLLAKLIRDEAHLEAVFTRFEAARKPRVERIVAEGRKKGGRQTHRGWVSAIYSRDDDAHFRQLIC